ncbi:hypothetical protein NDU88_001371 [Pleurodeles waltl]|uniref:Uncharacterized protein n=1 Tax=Pleurodeles waltl TaxID=8319 RepID=A0AAV7WI85_PLEWA|nr:hypothetical protein NDU88_001371 [Pleurodeles waltl]
MVDSRLCKQWYAVRQLPLLFSGFRESWCTLTHNRFVEQCTGVVYIVEEISGRRSAIAVCVVKTRVYFRNVYKLTKACEKRREREYGGAHNVAVGSMEGHTVGSEKIKIKNKLECTHWARVQKKTWHSLVGRGEERRGRFKNLNVHTGRVYRRRLGTHLFVRGGERR